jgi:hypothetical protein
MIAALRFLWNSTRGHRLRPWRSEFLKWRMETYTGQRAETIAAADFFRFLWRERAELVRFLLWAAELEREAAARPRA